MRNHGRPALFGSWVVAATLTLSACGGGHNGGSGGTLSTTTPVVPAPALVSIAVTPATATVRTGATQQPLVEAQGQGGAAAMAPGVSPTAAPMG